MKGIEYFCIPKILIITNIGRLVVKNTLYRKIWFREVWKVKSISKSIMNWGSLQSRKKKCFL